MSQDLAKDILLQIQDQQTQDAKTLGEILGELRGYNTRIVSLEHDQSRNWWLTVCIAPALALGHGIARKLGVNI